MKRQVIRSTESRNVLSHVRSMAARITWSVAAFVIMPASQLLAHPGHGVTDSSSPEHYTLEPGHGAPWVVGMVAVGLIAWVVYRVTIRSRLGSHGETGQPAPRDSGQS